MKNYLKIFGGNTNTNYLSQLVDLNFDLVGGLKHLIFLTVSYLIIASGIKIFIFL